MNVLLEEFVLPRDLETILNNSPSIIIPKTEEMLYDLIFGNGSTKQIDVSYDVNGTLVKEADVVRCKNGAVVNYAEDYMRRRDPDCMRIGDDKPTDKPRFQDVYGYDFNTLKVDTYKWLARQELILVPFMAGGYEYGYQALLVCPRNAAFFAFALSQLQAFVCAKDITTSSPVPSCMWLLPSVTLTSTASRCAYTTGWTTATRSLPTTCIPAPPPRRAFTAFCWTLASRRAGLLAHATRRQDRDPIRKRDGHDARGRFRRRQERAAAGCAPCAGRPRAAGHQSGNRRPGLPAHERYLYHLSGYRRYGHLPSLLPDRQRQAGPVRR